LVSVGVIASLNIVCMCFFGKRNELLGIGCDDLTAGKIDLEDDELSSFRRLRYWDVLDYVQMVIANIWVEARCIVDLRELYSGSL
jgi:hypothetical protein